MPTFTGRIFMGQFAKTRMHTAGHVASPVPDHIGLNAKHMMPGHIRNNNNQLPLHAKWVAISSDETLRTQTWHYRTSPTGTTTPRPKPSEISRAPEQHKITSQPVPKRPSPITATGKPSTSAEKPHAKPQTISNAANKSKLSPSLDAPSASVNVRNVRNHLVRVEARGGESMIDDEPTNLQANRNSFYNLLPYGNTNRSPQRETGHGTRYFLDGKPTFVPFCSVYEL